MKVVLDYETRSRAELKHTGTYLYATDPSTSVLCLAWRLDDAPHTYLWHPAFPNARPKAKTWVNAKGKRIRGLPPHLERYANGMPEYGRSDLEMLLLWITWGDVTEVEAHNAMFERVISRYVMPRHVPGFAIPDELWRCSAAKAASFSLPRDLKGAVNALGLAEKKDDSGKALINKLSKPNKNGDFCEEVESLLDLFAYCKQDVVAEEGLSANLRPLPPDELETWRLDQTINLRGVAVDTAFVKRALEITAEEQRAADLEVGILTGGAVDSTGQRDAMLAWLREQGYPAENLQGDTIDDVLKGAWELKPEVRRVLELRRSLGRTSTKKYEAIARSICADGRIRDLLAYHGAGTGRWAGRRVQPQNFPRGSISGDMDTFVADAKRYDTETLRLIYGDPMELLATALRGALIAPEGRVLNVADYAAIEARVVAWLAGQLDKLEMFAKGVDMYKAAASSIFSIPADKIAKDSRERQIGKAAELGLGFQMGSKKYVTNVFDTTGIVITEEFSEQVVKAWRAKNDRIVAFWSDIQAAAIEAITRGPGKAAVPCGKLAWAQRGRFLHVKLPSGRLLSYCDPRVEEKLVEGTRADGTKYSFTAPSIRFMGIDSKTHQWTSQFTYGGSLTENVTQAVARDLMRDAMHRLERTGVYETVLTVHDEVVAESDAAAGSVEEYENLVSQIEPWAAGLPVKAEAWRGGRYQK